MLKQWWKVGFIAILALALAACGSSNNSGTSEQGKGNAGGNDSPSKTKIAYWTIDRHDMEYMQGKIEEFNASNTAGIEVEMTVMADNFNQAVEVAFASNQSPDIFRIADFSTYVNKGYLAPLDELMTDEFKQKFDGLLKDNVTMMDGKIYSVPNQGQYWRLIYNVDLFEKAGLSAPPQTLAEMVEYADKITEAGKADGAYGFASNFKNTSGFTRPAYAIGSLTYGGLEGYNFKTGEFDFSIYQEVADALWQIRDNGSMMPGSETLDIDPLRAQFAQGKIGMYVNHSSEPAVYNSQFPTDVNWAAAVVPSVDGKASAASWVNSHGYVGISAQSEKQEAAYQFLEFLYSQEFRVAYQEAGLSISVLPYVNDHAKQPNIPGIEGFIPTEHDGIYPASPVSITETKVEGMKASDAFIAHIFTGKQADLEDLVANLNERYNKALDAVRSEGLTNIEAIPDFDPAALRGTLVGSDK